MPRQLTSGISNYEKIVEENNVDTKVAFKEIESLDNREELLELSKKTIPKPLEYTQTLFSNTELQELQDITKELEENYRDRQSDINVYEEEQENVFENREDDILETSITARLLSFPNVIVTSHQGFLTKEALEAISETTLQNAESFENGNLISNNVVSN